MQETEDIKPSRNGVKPPDYHEAKTMRNLAKSDIFCLPAELRMMIYKFVIYHGEVNIGNSWPFGWAQLKAHHRIYVHYPRNKLNILETCKLAHTEAKILPFSLNTFVGMVETFPSLPKVITEAQANKITTIRFKFDYFNLRVYSVTMQQEIGYAAALANIRITLQKLPALSTITLDWSDKMWDLYSLNDQIDSIMLLNRIKHGIGNAGVKLRRSLQVDIHAKETLDWAKP